MRERLRNERKPRSWPENRMASLELNVNVLCLHLKHQWHKARQGKYGRNSEILRFPGETQSNRVGVTKDSQ